MFLLILLSGIIYLSLYITYLFIKNNFYWSARNIVYIKSWTATIKPFIENKSFAESLQSIYNTYPNKRYVGTFEFLTPSLMIKDLNLIKKITIQDFDHFTDHLDLFVNKNDVIATSNLFSLKGEQWKSMRSTISPAFTSSKMKSMFVLMSKTAERFTKHLLKKPEHLLELEVKELYAKYSNDILATCAFGIDCDSMNDDQNEFYKMGKAASVFTFWGGIKLILLTFFPRFCRVFNIDLSANKASNFFKRTIRETINYRRKHGLVRPDLVNIILEAQQSDDVIAAQALLFFFAGFDTSSTLLSFISHELAVNQDIQEKLHEEIFGKKLTYDTIAELKYLDQIVSEALRKYPPGFVLNRLCVKDYKIPAINAEETPLVVEKGCGITVPVFAIHRDPRYYPEPDKFDPERFSDENKSKIVPGSYLPFGSGPRNCIASRFALLEIKVLVFRLLSEFKIQPVAKTRVPMKLAKGATIGCVGGFWLGLEKRQSIHKCKY